MQVTIRFELKALPTHAMIVSNKAVGFGRRLLEPRPIDKR